MLPHRLAAIPGNMLSVNQEIPEELVEPEKAVLCPLLAGQMSVCNFFDDDSVVNELMTPLIEQMMYFACVLIGS